MKTFLLGDLPNDVKFINCERNKEYFPAGDETKIKLYDYSSVQHLHDSLKPKKNRIR
jgi:hypothetical protein